ncbi:Clavaminate synthase-like protein [Hesseltinella vesiculosa]|uniref:Clavaminate synthase-like protein n=1 Tax=Hesseltinella vesiculosa TaxID=101127 RepID=A0A1X2GU04_9FUNG|nr:Clavaminate synthase-like protein [Hesseltinella vesiculosa]
MRPKTAVAAALTQRPWSSTSQPCPSHGTPASTHGNAGPIKSTSYDSLSVHVDWQPSHVHNQSIAQGPTSYSHVWLRDNCPCPACVHPDSRQKLHSSADVPVDIQPRSVTLEKDCLVVEWDQSLLYDQASANTPHVSRYPLPYLRRYASSKAMRAFRFEDLHHQTWAAKDYQLNWVSYHDYMNTDAGLHRVVQQLYHDGLVFLNDVPTEDTGVTTVAERIGPVQETFYGRDFDVKSVTKSVNIAYTSLYLGYHMDLMYLDGPPGVQLLHSLKNSVTGGSSIFVDSFRAVDTLKQQWPEDYAVLCNTPVTFHYINNGHHMYYRRPTIVAEDTNGEQTTWGMHVNYAPQFQGPMDHLTPQEMKRFYQAFQRFAQVIEDPSLRYQITLQPGQLVMFANRRVLHGRTQFDATSGERHLKGTYLTLDSLKDKLRVLGAKYAA